MGHDFFEIQDNLLTKKECIDTIEWAHSSKSFVPDVNKNNSGYDYCHLMNRGEDAVKCFSPKPLRPLYRAIKNLTDSYVKKFPEVNNLDKWQIQYVRFKWWKPGYSFSTWHSEHNITAPLRVLAFMVYLSDNDCCTEFRRYRNVKTRAGRGIMFPAYFTHEHKGNVCKKGIDRYVVSGYYAFI